MNQVCENTLISLPLYSFFHSLLILFIFCDVFIFFLFFSGYASISLSPAEASAMLKTQKGAGQQPNSQKKDFHSNAMFTRTFAEAFGEEDEPEGDWKYS
jgi:heme/copper-type cytochrome/quinol oxidase subunit 3